MEKLEQEVMQLLVLVAQKKSDEAIEKITILREDIYEQLDFAQADEEIVRYGKFLKILEDLENKI